MRSTKNMSARSSVASRKQSPGSPGWTSAKDLFQSPMSPSPKRRKTRRTSVYQGKTSTSDKFKMPSTNAFSPPGVKTRARRSSVYQKGGGRLLSPKNTRARRASMYISSKNVEEIKVFSKVWATPIRQPEPIQEAPEASKKQTSSLRKVTSSPVKPEKTPNPTRKTPRTMKRTPRSAKKTPKSTKKTPRSAVKLEKTPNSTRKTPRTMKKTPKSAKKTLKSTPRSARKSNTNENQEKQVSPKSAKRTAKRRSSKTSASPVSSQQKTSPVKPAVITSTPTKSLEQLTGKSFYATPGETPIPSQRSDDIFVFSAVPDQSSKKHVFKTPVGKPPRSQRKSTRNSSRKTSGGGRKSTTANKGETSTKVSQATKRQKLSSGEPDAEETSNTPPKSNKLKVPTKLSPEEMSSVLRSVEQVERTGKRKASPTLQSQDGQPSVPRADAADLPTPRVFKKVKRTSPKKLAEIVSVCQNTNNSNVDNPNTSVLNDTIYTDSRSGRCIIL